MSNAVKIVGIEEIVARMEKLGRNLKERSGRRVMKKALEPMLQSAIANTPNRTGKLKRSWKIKVKFDEKGQATGYVTNTFFTANLIESGHKQVSIVRKGELKMTMKNGLRRKRWSGGKTKTTTGWVPAQPMLRPAFDANADKAIEIYVQEMRKTLIGATTGAK